MSLSSSPLATSTFGASGGITVEPPAFDPSVFVRAQIVTRSVTGPVIVGASVGIRYATADGTSGGYAPAYNDAGEFIDPAGSYGDVRELFSDSIGQAAFWVPSGIYNLEVTKDDVTSKWKGYRVGQSQSRAVGTQQESLPTANDISTVIGALPSAIDTPAADLFVVEQEGEWRIATLAQMKQWINV